MISRRGQSQGEGQYTLPASSEGGGQAHSTGQAHPPALDIPASLCHPTMSNYVHTVRQSKNFSGLTSRDL